MDQALLVYSLVIAFLSGCGVGVFASRNTTGEALERARKAEEGQRKAEKATTHAENARKGAEAAADFFRAEAERHLTTLERAHGAD